PIKLSLVAESSSATRGCSSSAGGAGHDDRWYTPAGAVVDQALQESCAGSTPAASIGGSGVLLEVRVHEGDRHAALADCRRDALPEAESDITAGEDARDARLEEVGVPVVLPPSRRAHVGAGEHIALRVECDLRWEPRGLGVRTDEDEHPTRPEPRRLAGCGVT